MNALLVAALLAAAAPPPPPAAAPAAPARVAGADPADPSGEWRGARWGMGVDEVLKAFPGEARPMLPRLDLADGAVVAVEIPGVDLAGQAMDVRFVFAGGKLAIVSLRSPQRSHVPADTYQKLVGHLAARFGGPGEPMPEGMVGELRQTTWRLPRGVAELKHVQGVLVLQYHPAEAGAPATAPAR
jgi:hypothetical protein